MDKTVNWVNKMSELIAREEFERNIFELSLHGVSKEEIGKMRNNFEEHYSDKTNVSNKETKQALTSMGLYVGKKITTKVINR